METADGVRESLMGRAISRGQTLTLKDQDDEYTADHGPHLKKCDHKKEQCPYFVSISTYLGYLLLVLYGRIRDTIGKILFPKKYSHLRINNGLAPLTSDFESLYTRRLYKRIRDCWQRPITGVPSRTLTLLERVSKDYNETFQLTGRKFTVLNLSSYNYLGFAQAQGSCADAVERCIQLLGIGVGAPRADAELEIHEEVEKLVARFVGADSALVFNMGFATNALMIPALVNKETLIVSDELNHTSLVYGSRLSGGLVQRFRHNDSKDLERVIRNAIVYGQPRTRRPWKKIIVIVEGLYSMEGTILCLPEIIALKSRYPFYLFIDEAHSIGALGPRGKGVCDFFGVDPKKVDILMGTFTKSFGAAGGYIAGSKKLISQLKLTGIAHIYAEPMAPAVCQQVITSMKIILGEDGTDEGANRLRTIHANSVYFMRKLRKMGFVVYGDEGSPIVPVLIYQPGKISAFSHEALLRGMAVVVVGYPATPIDSARVRFCISASHTRKDLDYALEKISEIGDIMQLKFKRRHLLSWTGIF